MQASKIQLKQYFLSSFNYSVNPEFDPNKKLNMKFTDISVNHDAQPLNQETLLEWQVNLKAGFSPSAESNAPYSFSAQIVGFFSVNDKVAKEKITGLVETNATSVLYSTLREIIHTITAKGPYFPMLLPTVCFYGQKDAEPKAQQVTE
jgi:preprotein translocase subunit SecB